MKKILLFIVFGLITSSIYAQNVLEKSIPLLVPIKGESSHNNPKIKLGIDCVTKPMKVELKIRFDFYSAIHDTTKVLKLERAALMKLNYKKSGETVYVSKYDTNLTPFDQCIWKECSDIVNYWTKVQPYEKLDYTQIRGYLSAIDHGHPGKSFTRRLSILLIPNK